jgi:phosphoadenosine phosphosulfate reductase
VSMPLRKPVESQDRDHLAEIVAEAAPRLRGAAPQEVLEWGLVTFDRRRIALTTSFQREGMVILHMALRIDPWAQVFTIDTGRLPQETLDVVDQVRERYGIPIEVLYPDSRDVSALVTEHGPNLFYRSTELRLSCCEVRKVLPLERKLRTLDAWVTGVRRSHNLSREAVAEVEVDERHGGIVKLNPLASWTEAQVVDYVDEFHLPENQLYERGYTSIGCGPCTRATSPGEDPRAGRWWWEQGARECGLHWDIRVNQDGQSEVVTLDRDRVVSDAEEAGNV